MSIILCIRSHLRLRAFCLRLRNDWNHERASNVQSKHCLFQYWKGGQANNEMSIRIKRLFPIHLLRVSWVFSAKIIINNNLSPFLFFLNVELSRVDFNEGRKKTKKTFKEKTKSATAFIITLLKQHGWACPSMLSYGINQNVCPCARTQCGLFLFYRSGANRIQYGIPFFPASCRSTCVPYG